MPRKIPDSIRPRYLAIAQDLEHQITDGVFEESGPLPTFRELAEKYQVSIVTINQVMKELASRGRVIRRRGKGVFVAPKGLKRERTHIVGLVVPDITNPYFSQLAKSIQQLLFAHDHGVLTLSTDGRMRQFNQCLRQLANRKVDGIILIPLEINRTEQEESLWRLKVERIPFVYMDDHFARVPSDYVIVDIRRGVRNIAEHFLSLGHKNIACVSAQPYIEITDIKIHTLIDHLKENNAVLNEHQVEIGQGRHDKGGFEAALKVLERRPRPTAIFATNDIIAVGVIRAARSIGLSVPGDLSVAGFDDIQVAQIFEPSITTVSQPVGEIARDVTEILLARIDSELPPDFKQIILKPKLVVRESTAPVLPSQNKKRGKTALVE